MRIADAAGRPDEVSAVLRRLGRAAASRGVDLDPETVELGQRLLEGGRSAWPLRHVERPRNRRGARAGHPGWKDGGGVRFEGVEDG